MMHRRHQAIVRKKSWPQASSRPHNSRNNSDSSSNNSNSRAMSISSGTSRANNS